MSNPRVEIEAHWQVHQGSGRVVVRDEGERIVLDARADHCCVLVLGQHGRDAVGRDVRSVAGVTGPTRWVISPLDGRTHSLLPASDHPAGVLAARCGQLLPLGVPQHDHLPGWQLCESCLWCYLVPTGVFPVPESG